MKKLTRTQMLDALINKDDSVLNIQWVLVRNGSRCLVTVFIHNNINDSNDKNNGVPMVEYWLSKNEVDRHIVPIQTLPDNFIFEELIKVLNDRIGSISQ